ncbi:hypothetical protein IE81DRAFT_363937 [Ceraceosorus guamensis]|uniref:Lipase-like C-terminal domain-containing protein n=1 Tax=Ceraceosorus guamensis TaxID=1522189 RepID=A0A316WE53_9BASI|nr:hypothetical protein IE81DRAFT_363937 [Ceraceosorus guamensis]PWN45705.1 hypothetical protein IE81DRAFT_363937 [Ceraceosorus guamensis]
MTAPCQSRSIAHEQTDVLSVIHDLHEPHLQSPPDEHRRHQAPPPLILVEGFMCAASSLIWGDFPQELAAGAAHQRSSWKREGRKIFWAPIGPVSSLHDRACELFYSLHGGTVDYGEAHAQEHGHSRWGRRYPPASEGGGSYPQWSEKHPVHMVGHSLGGVTILKLRQLLLTGFFDQQLGIITPLGTLSQAAGLIRSITTVSSPLRGTPLVYLLGEQPTASPQVRFLSFGDVLAKSVHVAVWLRAHSASIRKLLPDPQADAWHFAGANKKEREDDIENASPEQGTSASSHAWSFRSLWGLPTLAQQLWKSDWAEGRDCAPWDCTLAERARCEQREVGWLLASHQSTQDLASQLPDCWFRSYAAYMTEPYPSSSDPSGAPRHRPTSVFNTSLSAAIFNITSKQIGAFDYHNARPSRLFGKSHVPSRSGLDAESGSTRGSTSQEGAEKDEQGSALRVEASEARYCADTPTNPAHRMDEEEEEDWYANDGVVPLASQYHPGMCGANTCAHYQSLPSPHLNPASKLDAVVADARRRPALARLMSAGDAAWRQVRGTNANTNGRATRSSSGVDPTCSALPVAGSDMSTMPNRWHVYTLKDATHASLCPIWNGDARQRHFWRGLGAWLADVDAMVAQKS